MVTNSHKVFTMLYYKIVLTVCAHVGFSAAVPWEAEPRDDWWIHNRHDPLLNQTKMHAFEMKAIFLGDSLTRNWANNGAKVWAEHYESRHAFNYGLGGDRTEHVLWRIENGELEGVKPKVVVLMIGTNNISNKDNATAIARGINTICEAIQHKMADAKVLLLSVLPRASVAFDTEVHAINELISRFADNTRVNYLDLAVHFEVSLAHEIAEMYTDDHVHLSEKGYVLWHKLMEPSFAKLIA